MDPSWNSQPQSESFQRRLLAFQVTAKISPRLDEDSFFSVSTLVSHHIPGSPHRGALSIPQHYSLLPPQSFCHTVLLLECPSNECHLLGERVQNSLTRSDPSLKLFQNTLNFFLCSLCSQDPVLDLFHHLVTVHLLH